MKLFGYWRSSSSWRVRIALAHKGLDYEYMAIHLRDGVQRESWFADLNAAKQVPLLQLSGGRRLGQSMAILDYLERAHPEPALMPTDPYLRARAFQLAEVVNSGIQPLQNLAVIQKLKAMEQDAKAWCQQVISNGLDAFEATAADVAGEFCVADQPSWADVLLVPQLYNARRFGLDVGTWPRIRAIEEKCLALPAFWDSRPEAMPDAEASS